MDTQTGFVMATLLMLLNGGVLGIMHKSLSSDVQPSAADWRVGTLLFASGTCLMAFQDFLPFTWNLALANLGMSVGLALYWRAVRRLVGLPDTLWLFAPAVAVGVGIYIFSAVYPHFSIRVYIATVVWCFYVSMSVWNLHFTGRFLDLHSRRVLAGIFTIVGVFLLARGLSFAINPVREFTVLTPNSFFNLLTPLVCSTLPIVGTSAFLVMCSERLRQQWQNAAATDYLTGLPNRRAIHASGITYFNNAQRSGLNACLAVAVIDIDHFKSVNDRWGHEAGDLALLHVATLLAENCRGPHTVGRQGGEEFVALFNVNETTQAHTAAERLRHAVETNPLQLAAGQVEPLTISIGVGIYDCNDTSYDVLLLRADAALYKAKEGGRNRTVIASA
jgi:diguanylate cyclase (GGDEF)-like protein